MKKFLSVVLCFLIVFSAQAQDLKIWDLPAGAKPESRDGWKDGSGAGSFKSGAAVENDKIVLLAAPGRGIVVSSLDKDAPSSVDIGVVDDKGAECKVDKVKIDKKEASEVTLQADCGATVVKLRVALGRPFVEVIPVKGAVSVDVRGKTAYAVLPDFFGNDVVFDPRRFKTDKMTAPAENFLLNMQAGGNAIVMCVWQGTLSLGKKDEKVAEAKEPKVDLFFAGQEKDRIIEKSRIEFVGKPVFVALMAKKGLWYELDVSAEPAQKAIALDWQRPFEAKWRVDFLSREGSFSKDMTTGIVSWDAWYTSEQPGRPDGLENPTMSMQGLWPYFQIPAWIKDGKKADGKFYIAMYSDMNDRKAAEKKNNELRAAAKKENKDFVQVYPTNVFERVVVYPVDRRKNTPLTEVTPTDVMRDALGQGPCAYVLDLEGIANVKSGGTRETLATCGTYDTYITKYVDVFKGRAASFQVNGQVRKIAGVKEGEKLTAEDEAFLVEKLEDLVLFVTTVNKRLRQYQQFYSDLVAYCNEQGQKNQKVKPVADKILQQAKNLAIRVSEKDLKAKNDKRDKWEKDINAIIAEVKAGTYTNVHKSGGIRDDLAEPQDVQVSFCRKAVKGIRSEASMADSSDPDVLKFATRVRNMCHDVLRNKHGMEGW